MSLQKFQVTVKLTDASSVRLNIRHQRSDRAEGGRRVRVGSLDQGTSLRRVGGDGPSAADRGQEENEAGELNHCECGI